jgi:ATP-dependent Clp protease adapter protein ClpS
VFQDVRLIPASLKKGNYMFGLDIGLWHHEGVLRMLALGMNGSFVLNYWMGPNGVSPIEWNVADSWAPSDKERMLDYFRSEGTSWLERHANTETLAALLEEWQKSGIPASPRWPYDPRRKAPVHALYIAALREHLGDIGRAKLYLSRYCDHIARIPVREAEHTRCTEYLGHLSMLSGQQELTGARLRGTGLEHESMSGQQARWVGPVTSALRAASNGIYRRATNMLGRLKAGYRRTSAKPVNLPGLSYPVIFLPEPQLFQHGIELLNDNQTPMQFVVQTLHEHAGISKGDATMAMALCHSLGGIVVPLASQQETEQAAARVSEAARLAGFPFVCRPVSARKGDA